MIENILILDTETTGLNAKKGDQIIEIAVVLFNLKYKCVLQCFSTLLPCHENPVESINHIPADATLCDYPHAIEDGSFELNDDFYMSCEDSTVIIPYDFFYNITIKEMFNHCDAIVAHNMQFDMGFIEQLPKSAFLLEKKWICTKKNFTWPVHLKRLRLQDICDAMHVPYVNAHRAMADCLLLAQCFQNVEDLQARFDRCI